MKKIISLALTLFMIAISVVAQDDAPKKKGGFWNKVKKGVESTTGIDVSRETLFVYPEIGRFQMQLGSAVGDPVSGNVQVIFKVMPLDGTQSAALSMNEVIGGDGVVLEPDRQWEHGSNQQFLSAGNFTEYKLRRISVSPGMKSLKTIKFKFEGKEGFEARDIPITWATANE